MQQVKDFWVEITLLIAGGIAGILAWRYRSVINKMEEQKDGRINKLETEVINIQEHMKFLPTADDVRGIVNILEKTVEKLNTTVEKIGDEMKEEIRRLYDKTVPKESAKDMVSAIVSDAIIAHINNCSKRNKE